MTAEPDLYDLIRQLKTELEWAVRTGIVVEPPKVIAAPSQKAITQPDRPAPPPERAPPPVREIRSSPPVREAPPSREIRSPPPVREAPPPSEIRSQPAPERAHPAPEREKPWPPEWKSDREGWDREAPPPDDRDAPPLPRDIARRPMASRESQAQRSDRPQPAPQQQPQRAPSPRDTISDRPGLPGSQIDRDGRARTEEALIQIGARPSLAAIREVLGDCTRCKLHKQGRKQIVFGVGNATADLMFVGEGPGADEDRQGEPFVGKAGQLLTQIIERGMGIRRADVYIANIVKCRPPQNRDPEPDEVDACEPFLRAQIRSIAPKVIITLGKHASHALLKNTTPITRLRGRWSEYDGIPVMPTYHPAYLLRNPAEKRAVWEDIQEVLKRLGRPIPERGARD